MLDRLAEYADCLIEPDRWVMATVAAVSGSVPRPIGTSMAVRDDAVTIGSISAGCVESALVEAAFNTLETGRASLESFGYGDDDGLAVGLMCGGDLLVLVQPFTQLAPALERLLAAGADAHRYALVRRLMGERLGEAALLDLDQLDPAHLEVEFGPGSAQLVDQLRAGGAQNLGIRENDGHACPITQRLLVESPRSRPRLLIYGANDYAAALARAATLLDRHVVVCDARPVFATRRRHPGADEVVVEHPVDHLRSQLDHGLADERTAVVVLTHNPLYDLPVLDLALRSPLSYVGAMGSRQTQQRRAQDLANGGLPPSLLRCLHSPIGLNLGATTPQEVAVSILAELISVSHRRQDEDLLPLRRTVGPVHAARRPVAPSLDRSPSWT